jgi:carboxymethylenebutenolidase
VVFCFGGHVAFLAATLPRMAATASFYGAGIATLTPGGGKPTLTRAGEIKGEIALFFGEKDPLIPKDQVAQIDSELARVGARYEIHTYGAGHGFFCDHRADFRKEAAEDAWKKTLALFRKNLS